MADVTIFTDGSASPVDKSGGWGAILVSPGREKIVTGYTSNTTNQRMELMAAITALAALNPTRRWKVQLYSDSAYLVNCFKQGWIENWVANGWRNYRNKPVANRELWETLESLVVLYDVEFIHVKGHAGHAVNERVDRLASDARRQGIATSRGKSQTHSQRSRRASRNVQHVRER
jgi:ribonuclease HI